MTWDRAQVYLLAYRTGRDPELLLQKPIDQIVEEMAAYKLLRGGELL